VNSPNSPPLVAINGLSVRINGKTLLADLSLDIHEGDYLAVIGPNGAGKTTLLKAMLGLIRAGSGEIRLMGKRLERYSGRERARWIGYVPQASESGLSCTVEEFVMMGRYPYLSRFSPPGPRDRDAVNRAMALTETDRLRFRTLDTLSGGERQKVLIAGALAQQPRLLLLDEPSSFLDPRNESEVQALLQAVNRDVGVTVVSVTHNLNDVLRSARRVLGLQAGRVVHAGEVGDLLAPGVLRRIYNMHFRIIASGSVEDAVVIPEKAAADGAG
jgi:iron complex transport system ATP-binding protein